MYILSEGTLLCRFFLQWPTRGMSGEKYSLAENICLFLTPAEGDSSTLTASGLYVREAHLKIEMSWKMGWIP